MEQKNVFKRKISSNIIHWRIKKWEVYGKKSKKNLNKKHNNSYSNIDPKKFEQILESAVFKTRKELKEEYDKKLNKIEREYEDLIHYNVKIALERLQTEFIYELANKMNYWNLKDDTEYHKYVKDSAKYQIEDIYRNVFKSIDKYSKMENDEQTKRLYKFKKNRINNEFNLKIKERNDG